MKIKREETIDIFASAKKVLKRRSRVGKKIMSILGKGEQMSYLGNSARSSPQRERQSLVTIEQLLDTVNLRQLTGENLSRLENDLYRIIVAIHKAPIENFESKEEILINLHEALNQLGIAVDCSDRQGKSSRLFYQALRQCQASMIKALECW